MDLTHNKIHKWLICILMHICLSVLMLKMYLYSGIRDLKFEFLQFLQLTCNTGCEVCTTCYLPDGLALELLHPARLSVRGLVPVAQLAHHFCPTLNALSTGRRAIISGMNSSYHTVPSLHQHNLLTAKYPICNRNKKHNCIFTELSLILHTMSSAK